MLKKRLLKSMYILEAFSLIVLKKNTIITNFQSIEMKICRVVPILDTVGHMTNCTKNNFKKESIDYAHRAYPSVVGHVTNCI